MRSNNARQPRQIINNVRAAAAPASVFCGSISAFLFKEEAGNKNVFAKRHSGAIKK